MTQTDPRPAPRPSILARLGLGYLPPEPPVTGKRARVTWWQKVRSLIILTVLVLILGAAVAAGIGAIVFLAGFILEQAVN